MQVSYSDQIHWSDSNKDVCEEYCAVLPQSFGRIVKQCQQYDDKQAVPCSIKTRVAKYRPKILILFSHFTVIVPLAVCVGKAINRKLNPLNIAPPALLNPHNHQYLEEAKEIRKLREDSHYVPEGCMRFPAPIRFKLPADSILEELYPEIKSKDLLERMMAFYTPLNEDLKQKQEQILAQGFNGFSCAHGIENAKGGVRNLLNVMLEGVLRAPYAGGLMEGPSDLVAGSHGPFYVILNPAYSNAANHRWGLWNEDAQDCVFSTKCRDAQIPGKRTRQGCRKRIYYRRRKAARDAKSHHL